MPGSEPTHGDILEKLGELKGQVQALISMVGQKREDINALHERIGILEKTSASRSEMSSAIHRITGLEKEIAKWAGICIAIAVLMPVMMPQLQRALQVVQAPSIPHRGQP